MAISSVSFGADNLAAEGKFASKAKKEGLPTWAKVAIPAAGVVVAGTVGLGIAAKKGRLDKFPEFMRKFGEVVSDTAEKAVYAVKKKISDIKIGGLEKKVAKATDAASADGLTEEAKTALTKKADDIAAKLTEAKGKAPVEPTLFKPKVATEATKVDVEG